MAKSLNLTLFELAAAEGAHGEIFEKALYVFAKGLEERVETRHQEHAEDDGGGHAEKLRNADCVS